MGASADSTDGTMPDWVRSDIEQRIDQHMLELPLLPDVAIEALQLCQTGDYDARQMVLILHRDQALAGNVLRVANSPLFGASVEITSLRQAVSRIGIRMITEIMLSVATKTAISGVPEAWRGCVGDVARLSLVSALYAKEVASLSGANIDSAFLTGLLHNMGTPAVMFLLEKLEKKHDRSLEMATVEAAVDAYHAQVGSQLAKTWGLAADLVAAILHVEDWAALNEHSHEAPIVSLADALARVAIPEFPETAEMVLNHPAVSVLNLDASQVQSLLQMSDRVLEMADVVE